MTVDMKKLILISSVVIGLTACSNDEPGDSGFTPIELSRADQEIVTEMNTMSFNLLAASLQSDEATYRSKVNAVVSPFSMEMALGMTANTVSENPDRMPRAYGAANCTEWNTFNYNIAARLQQADRKGGKLQICNFLWTNTRYNVIPECPKIISKYYHAQIGSEDFQKVNMQNVVNDAVNKATDGIIPKLLENRINGSVPFILANTLYFKGTWKNKFNPNKTKNGDFHDVNGKTVQQTKLMYQCEDFDFAEFDGAKALGMKYGNGAFEMLAILPPIGVLPLDYAATLNGRRLDEIVNLMATKEVEVTFPRFDVEHKFQIVGSEKGLTLPGDYNGLIADPMRGDMMPTMLQKVRVIVDEDGTTAVAATVSSWEGAAPVIKPTFKADRPFIYMIRETSTGMVLFLGVFQSR